MAIQYYPPTAIEHLAPQEHMYPEEGSPFTFLYKHIGNQIIDYRTVVVFIDGACRQNGSGDARGGIGVYFGPRSVFNVSGRIEADSMRVTNQRAEVLAAIYALNTVPIKKLRTWGINRIILASDSKYVINAITMWIYKWRRVGWVTLKGTPVANRAELERLYKIVAGLCKENIDVQFWSVPREFNVKADALAKKALRD